MLRALAVVALLLAQDPTLKVYPPGPGTDALGASPVPDPPLLSGAINCWNFDEAAGLTRVDDCGSNDITEGTGDDVIIVTGQNNNGFRANIGPDACLTGTVVDLGETEFTINMWFTGLSANSQAFRNGDLFVTYNEGFEDDFWQLAVTGQSNSGCAVVAPASGFHMLTAWIHPSDGKLHCILDNDPATENVATLTLGTVSYTGTLFAGSGTCSFPFSPAGFDELSLWDRALSADSREELLTTFAPY